MKSGIGNVIEEGVVLPENLILGNYNTFRKGVKFEMLDPNATVIIGDCNVFNEQVKVLVGAEGFETGDWNVFHNQILITAIGNIKTTIGHNCWVGQNTILDGSGGLTIGNGVRIGMYSQVWSHVASGEQIEGCLLYGKGHTILENDVWLVGSCIVGSGVRIREKSICLTTSFINKDTEPNLTYAGNPAKRFDKLKLWYTPTIQQKFEMMHNWCIEFADANKEISLELANEEITLKQGQDEVIIGYTGNTKRKLSNSQSYFDLQTKTYIKSLSPLERKFYKFIYNNKARFLPIKDANE